jgi:EAL domain-containing protein (putative c-di-GMP-specific phosphodiesterase class I)/GGDEF domain-containing protein
MIDGATLEGIDAAVALVEGSGALLEWTARFEARFGKGRHLVELLGAERAQTLRERLEEWGDWCGPLGEEGDALWVEGRRVDGSAPRYLLFFDDRRRCAGWWEAQIERSRRDRTTGLPHYNALLESMESRPETNGALFFIAFDDIHRADDGLEGAREERILRELARRFEGLAEPGDRLAYLGSDKFVFVRPGIERVQEAEELARYLIHRHAEPLAVGGELFYLNLAIGITLYPFDGDVPSELVRLAEKAMREARHNGWNRYAFYHHLRSETRMDCLERLRRELPEAIEREEIHFHYQPQFSLKEGRYNGAEMLVRWRHRELGEISPELFLPLAERSGMIRFITMRALTQASKTFEKLAELGREDFSLSINLSPTTIFHRDFLENLEFFLTHYGLQGRPLHFEITENALAHNMTVMKETLGRIRRLGVGIEIDDYGTGYTSLQTLIELPVDTVKIDRQFVRHLDHDPKVGTLYRAMTQTADALGLEVIAEGVEEEAELRAIERLGPVTIQGWYFARAMEEEALLELLRG